MRKLHPASSEIASIMAENFCIAIEKLDKPAYTISDQTALLKQRGMLFKNEAEDYERLKNIKNAKKENDFFLDNKYVKTACGTAYCGILVALDGFLQLKKIKPKGKERKSIECTGR